MYLPGYRNPSRQSKDLYFPRLESWNPVSKTGTVAVQVNKKRVLCRISFELLQKKFRATVENPLQAMKDNRTAIEAAIQKLVEKGNYQADGSIIIRAADL
jgi:hypothetical protein